MTVDREKQTSIFNDKTEKLFSNEFKGFDFEVGEKKFRYKVNDVEGVKSKQGDISNFVKKFLNDKNEMADADYHKAIYAARNADTLAQHFYEQGKADAVKVEGGSKRKETIQARTGSSGDISVGGFKVKAISGFDSKNLKIKTRKFN